MYLTMTIYGFALDSIAQMPVVLLKNADESSTLPIWINSSDALYIVAELVRHEASSRSDRKDLLSALLRHLQADVEDIAIDDMKDGLISASVGLTVGGEPLRLDVRVSEALVMALKHSLPVMVASHLLDTSMSPSDTEHEHFTEADERRFVDFLDNLDPADLGKYPM
ncbi:MAG: bifunctional nuclease family protein [Desulfuromonadales bacterium]|nr:MAG: bifunctional nuclease family protein [Desulfuromonadales bacterium]